ncbi:MAG: response regulator transcription factor [Lachnospiraceae bacterium]|nr:response regulator transcription factor [Lachnospiraceae bacterium]MBP5253959.1 response regulator transcription factor [Lachnospiraceae bacterium]
MVTVAIVEDQDQEAEKLIRYLGRFGEQEKEEFSVKRFSDAFTFLEEKQAFDIVFMDIMLPHLNGMEAAQKMRRTNTRSVLIFVTNMLNFAVKSYEVDALDYIVKPISYERVVFKLRKALENIRTSRGKLLSLNTSDGWVPISSSDICYIEVVQHKLIYHTLRGVYYEKNTMKNVEETLAGLDFSRCNACYLVNMQFIRTVNGLIITMTDGDELKISQPKRKQFMTDLSNFLGQKR